MVQAKADGSMKSCVGCKYAVWKKRNGGNLHPSGEGQCDYPVKIQKLPNAFYWVGWNGYEPEPNGGQINRKETYKNDCIYYEESNRI